MPDFISMGDAAYANNLDGTNFDVVAGYLGGPNAYHTWAAQDWAGIPGPKLPIWVAGYDGAGEGRAALVSLEGLGITSGIIALDLENRIDRTYVDNFGRIVQSKFKVWVYGSANSVFQNPSLNGYWVADYAGIGPFMYNGQSVRATQYAAGPKYDFSLVREWVVSSLWT
jgi:hypothetical protein